MIEAPLLIRPYLARLTRAELFMLFTVGLATVAGTVMVLYASHPRTRGARRAGAYSGRLVHFAARGDPGRAARWCRATAPPPADEHMAVEYRSSMDAVARGTEDGLKLYLGIVAMLIVMVALVALANIVLAHLPDVGGAPRHGRARVRLAVRAGGVALWRARGRGGRRPESLLGTKTILNEFIAYLKLAALPDGALSPRSRLIMLYAHVRLRQSGLGRHHDRGDSAA